MSNWGIRPEFRDRELRKAVEIVSRELIRQLSHGLADPDLANFLTKSTRALIRKARAGITAKEGKQNVKEQPSKA